MQIFLVNLQVEKAPDTLVIESPLHLLSLSSKSVQSTPCSKRFSMCFFFVQGLDLCGWCKSTTSRLSKCYYFAAARHCWKSIQQVTWNSFVWRFVSSFYLLCLFIGACFFKQDNLSHFSFIFHTTISNMAKTIWFPFVWAALRAAWGHGTVGRICFFWRWTSIMVKTHRVAICFSWCNINQVQYSILHHDILWYDMIWYDWYICIDLRLTNRWGWKLLDPTQPVSLFYEWSLVLFTVKFKS